MQSKNYESFGLMESNRKVNHGLVKRLVKSIDEIGYIEARPVIVNEDMIIIDGQHRFEACKLLELPIVYEVCKVDSKKVMINLNMNQVNWTLGEYVNSWAIEGIPCYKYVVEFENQYKLGISISLMICSSVKGGRGDWVRKGTEFKINTKAHEVANFILNCKPYFSFYLTVHFVRSIEMLFKHTTPENCQKVFSKIQSLQQQVSVQNYLNVYENILNRYKKSDETKIIIKGSK